MAESPVVWFNSSVVSVSSPLLAPIRMVPSGEAQLEWYRRFLWRVCDFFQLPSLKWTHVTSVSFPPQASSPVWEWSRRFLGRSGREHQGEPSLLSASTDSVPPSKLKLFPPLTMIAAAKSKCQENYRVSQKSVLTLFLSFSRVLEHVQSNFWPLFNSPGNLLHDSHKNF